MKQKLNKLIAPLVLLTTLSNADMLGGEISLGMYSHSTSGSATYNLGRYNDNLSLSSDYGYIFKAYLEHPWPLIPNVKIASSTMDVGDSLSMNINDFTAYYEILDSDIELDVGVTLRYLYGDIGVNAGAKDISYSNLLGMFYGKGRYVISDTGFAVQVEANAMHYDNTKMYDYEIALRYTIAMGLGFEGGYKAVYLNSDEIEKGLNLDLNTNGVYGSLVWDF